MESILLSVGWLLGSLGGLLPLIPAVRRFAASSLQRRLGLMALCGALAFITGAIAVYWGACYSTVGFFAWYVMKGGLSPSMGFTFPQIRSNRISITNQVMLQSTILRNTCLSSTPEVCEISKYILENGFNSTNMLPAAHGLSIIPAAIALLISKRLTDAPKQPKAMCYNENMF